MPSGGATEGAAALRRWSATETRLRGRAGTSLRGVLTRNGRWLAKCLGALGGRGMRGSMRSAWSIPRPASRPLLCEPPEPWLPSAPWRGPSLLYRGGDDSRRSSPAKEAARPPVNEDGTGAVEGRSMSTNSAEPNDAPWARRFRAPRVRAEPFRASAELRARETALRCLGAGAKAAARKPQTARPQRPVLSPNKGVDSGQVERLSMTLGGHPGRWEPPSRSHRIGSMCWSFLPLFWPSRSPFDTQDGR